MPKTLIDPHTIEALRARVSNNWSHLKDKVRATFSRLTDEDVEAVGGRYDELSSRVSKIYGYDADRTNDEISRFVSEGGNSAAFTAAAEEPVALDHRGMGAEVGRNDQPIPLPLERLSDPDASLRRPR